MVLVWVAGLGLGGTAACRGLWRGLGLIGRVLGLIGWRVGGVVAAGRGLGPVLR